MEAGSDAGLDTERSIRTPPRPKPDGGPSLHDPRRWCGPGSKIRNPASYRYNSLASNDFTYCFTFFSKSFSSFPHGTCSLSVSHMYLALEGVYLQFWAALPSNPTHRKRIVNDAQCHVRDCHPLRCAVPSNLSTAHSP